MNTILIVLFGVIFTAMVQDIVGVKIEPVGVGALIYKITIFSSGVAAGCSLGLFWAKWR